MKKFEYINDKGEIESLSSDEFLRNCLVIFTTALLSGTLSEHEFVTTMYVFIKGFKL